MHSLAHRSEFEAIIKNYRPSIESMAILVNMRLVLLAGPSAAGRNTVIERLVTTGNYQYIVSDTTRKPRINNEQKEQNGHAYWFRSERDFLDDLGRGYFLEAEIIHDRQVSGISMRELSRAHESGKVAITEIEIGGFLHIINLKPDTIGIFLIPPDFKTWLQRLANRGQISDEEMISRLNTGLLVFEAAKTMEASKVVVNLNLDQTQQEIEHIVAHNGHVRTEDRTDLLDHLIVDTQAYLHR